MKHPIGYSIAVILEYLIAVNVEFFAMCIMIIATGPCLILISITDDMECSLKNLDKSARTKECPRKIIQQFNEFIQFHAKTKQLSE